MKTMAPIKNQNNGRRVHEFPRPWRPYEFEYNKIVICGNIVRVYSDGWYYRAVILDKKPDSAYWQDRDLVVSFPGGSVRKFADDGCWGPEYVGNRLLIQDNDILVYDRRGGRVTLHNEQPVLRTQWFVYGGRHVVWVGLETDGRYFSSPRFYEHAATMKEMRESMQENCDKWNKILNPTGEKISGQPDSGKVSIQVKFFPGF